MKIFKFTFYHKINLQNGIVDFATMSTDDNNRVGCAGVWFPKDGEGWINFGCNYASKFKYGRPNYLEGSVASKCETGRDSKFSGLCSIVEKY